MTIEIKESPSQEEIKQALEGGLNDLWKLFKGLEGNKEFMDEYFKVKWGINEKFDIRSVIEGFVEMQVAFGQVKVERKNIIEITKFRDEIDRREKIMRDIIRELVDESFDSQKEVENEDYD